MKYKYLLFDADDTLLDFKASEQAALRMLFDSIHIPLTKVLHDQYQEINHALWAAFERGEISKEDILKTRFRKLFAKVGLEIDRPNLEAEYQEMLASGHMIIPGAFDVLDQLREHYDLFIVSNGVATTQYNRLHASGLFPYFKNVFISEETGFQKPQVEFFQYAFARIPNFEASRTLIIGDSLTSDIQGGINAGIDTCWYNPNKIDKIKELPTTYHIHTLKELCSILL